MTSSTQSSGSAKQVLAVAAALAIAAIAYLFGVPGVIRSGPALSDQRDHLRTELDSLRPHNQRREEFQRRKADRAEQIQQAQTQIDQLRAIVPDAPQAEGIKSLVNASSAAAGVQLKSMEAQDTHSRDFYGEAPFRLRVDGTYDALSKFLERLGHEERIVSVSEISLAPPVQAGGAAIHPTESLSMTCRLTAYFMKSRER